MDIRSYDTILPSTSKSAQPPVDTSGSSDSDSEADSECLDPKPSPPKKLCTASQKWSKSRSLTSKRKQWCIKGGA